MNRTRPYLLSFLLAVFSSAGLLLADPIDDFIAAEMKRQHIPGLALTVIAKGQVVKSSGYGWADLENKIPVQPNTLFKIGSISKPFLAMGILQLVDEGKLKLDDLIHPFLDQPPSSWRTITIRHLLTHTSGLVREAPGFASSRVKSDAEVIRSAYPLPLLFQPGEQFEYCNVGYFILAEIIHKVTGKPWPEFFQQRFFGPLGMESSFETTRGNPPRQPARGYVSREGIWTELKNYVALRPSGAFYSTIEDLAKWDAALDGEKLLKASWKEQMWTPAKLTDGSFASYGLGWYVQEIHGKPVVRHGGSLNGFKAEFLRFTSQKTTIIILTNLDGAKPLDIAKGVAEVYLK